MNECPLMPRFTLRPLTLIVWFSSLVRLPEADRLVLSEGHAVPVVYAAAAKLGMMIGKDPSARRKLTEADLKNLRAANSELDGHPNPMEGFAFFDAATGSLGQGLSIAAGVAEAARLDGTDRKVYCIVGDGESREGQIAEAWDYIVDRKIKNLLTIINCNEYGQSDRVSNQQSPEVLEAKLKATGFEVRVIDGHQPSQINSVFDEFTSGEERRLALTSALASGDSFTIEPPAQAKTAADNNAEVPTFNEFLKSNDMESAIHAGAMATRRAYGLALRAIGQVNDKVVVLDADVSNSTFAEFFKKDSKCASRFMECKIGEQNMISVGAGLSAAGKVPFCSTFAKFVTRAYDQIEMAIYSGANLKIIGSHCGVTLAADGPSQMSLPDVAWFRSFATMKDHRGNPGCYILQPADAYAAYALTQVMAEYEGVCYMRTGRPDVEFLYSDDHVFNLGGFEHLAEGRDLTICSAGYMVHECNKAIELLDKKGVSVGLVDLYSLPFEAEGVLDIIGASSGNVMTVEDNFGGALGSAIAEALLESGDGFRLKQMHVTRIPKSARTPEEVLKMCNLTADDIVKNAMELLGV